MEPYTIPSQTTRSEAKRLMLQHCIAWRLPCGHTVTAKSSWVSHAEDGVESKHIICPHCKRADPSLLYLTSDGVRLIMSHGLAAADVRYFNLTEFAEMAFEGW
jgi:hypothetical protein